jgi:hypothetical protein
MLYLFVSFHFSTFRCKDWLFISTWTHPQPFSNKLKARRQNKTRGRQEQRDILSVNYLGCLPLVDWGVNETPVWLFFVVVL